jgi:Lipocalin-like domain
MADTTALLGTWKMTSWKREIVANGEKIDALGADPVGFINYGPDGRFYALVRSFNCVQSQPLAPCASRRRAGP